MEKTGLMNGSRTVLLTRQDHERLIGHLNLLSRNRQQTADLEYLAELCDALGRAEVVDQIPGHLQVIVIGTTFKLLNLFNNEEFLYTLVMPEEEDISCGRLSVIDPLGAALLGHREGDVIDLTSCHSGGFLKVLEIIDQPVAPLGRSDRKLIPMLYSQVTGCSSELVELYVSLFRGCRDAAVLPLHLDDLNLATSLFVDRMEMILDELEQDHECPLMIVEWQWHENIARLIGLLHERRQEALFVKEGDHQAIQRVVALMSGSRQTLRNLKIAARIAAHLGVSVRAVRVHKPDPPGFDGEEEGADRIEQLRRSTEARLQTLGISMPVDVILGDGVVSEVCEKTLPTDLIVLGSPTDLFSQSGFASSLAGRFLRECRATVLMRLPGRRQDARLSLADVFWEGNIVNELVARNKEQAFDELLDALTQAGQVPRERRGEILRAIRLRELDGSTYVGRGIALPHAALENFSGLIGCLGISRQGIEYEIGKEPVHVIFLLISSRRNYAEYLEIQSKIARFMSGQRRPRGGQIAHCRNAAEVAQLMLAQGASWNGIDRVKGAKSHDTVWTNFDHG